MKQFAEEIPYKFIRDDQEFPEPPIHLDTQPVAPSETRESVGQAASSSSATGLAPSVANASPPERPPVEEATSSSQREESPSKRPRTALEATQGAEADLADETNIPPISDGGIQAREKAILEAARLEEETRETIMQRSEEAKENRDDLSDLTKALSHTQENVLHTSAEAAEKLQTTKGTVLALTSLFEKKAEEAAGSSSSSRNPVGEKVVYEQQRGNTTKIEFTKNATLEEKVKSLARHSCTTVDLCFQVSSPWTAITSCFCSS